MHFVSVPGDAKDMVKFAGALTYRRNKRVGLSKVRWVEATFDFVGRTCVDLSRSATGPGDGSAVEENPNADRKGASLIADFRFPTKVDKAETRGSCEFVFRMTEPPVAAPGKDPSLLLEWQVTGKKDWDHLSGVLDLAITADGRVSIGANSDETSRKHFSLS